LLTGLLLVGVLSKSTCLTNLPATVTMPKSCVQLNFEPSRNNLCSNDRNKAIIRQTKEGTVRGGLVYQASSSTTRVSNNTSNKQVQVKENTRDATCVLHVDSLVTGEMHVPSFNQPSSNSNPQAQSHQQVEQLDNSREKDSVILTLSSFILKILRGKREARLTVTL